MNTENNWLKIIIFFITYRTKLVHIFQINTQNKTNNYLQQTSFAPYKDKQKTSGIYMIKHILN